MIGLKATVSFDGRGLAKRMDSGIRAVLMRFGAFVRRRAQTSMRKAPKGKVSEPGSPPRYHTKQLRNAIAFNYDPSRRVVIGPTLAGKRPKGRATGPEVLEAGGRVPTKRGAADYKARPYMLPAFKAELQSIDKLWNNILDKTKG